MKEFIISKKNEGQRLDKYLARILGNSGMSFIFKMLRKKNFVLNDKKATGKEILKDGDIVRLYISDETFDKFKSDAESDLRNNIQNKSFSLEKNIVYEDDDIILVNKPANLLSQKAEKNDVSLNEYVIDYLSGKGEINKETLIDYKPSVVNRLDRNTTGLIIACKNLKAAQTLSESLKDRSINKYYKCLTFGEFSATGKYKGYLYKDTAKNKVTITSDKLNSDSSFIETEYNLIKSDNEKSLVEVHLITGKPHQIRAHMSYLGFPIIGDSKYGNAEINKKYKARYQLLHAYKIVFPEYDENYKFKFSGQTFVCEPDFNIS